VRLRIGGNVPAERFEDPSFNPATDPYTPLGPSSDLIDSIVTDPHLDPTTWAVDQTAFRAAASRTSLSSLLRQQQYVVYDIASQVGVLNQFLGKTRQALQGFDVILHNPTVQAMVDQALQATIGIAGNVLSAVPSIYTQIASALLSYVDNLLGIALGYGPGKLTEKLLPAQNYSDRTDTSLFNNHFRNVMASGYDWNAIFMPPFVGSLTAQVRENRQGQQVLAWALGDGEVPTPILDHKVGKPIDYHFDVQGSFDPGQGLGMIPGGQKICSVVQSTITESPVGPDVDHPTLYDPRCGQGGATGTIDVGTFYPVTAQGGTSLWSFCFQRGAALYTIDTGKIIDAWEDYVKAIWDGVVALWHNPDWQGEGGKHGLPGWGCEVWESTLSDLVRNYTVGLNGALNVLSWAPVPGSEITADDDDNWRDANMWTQIIRPALLQMQEAQIWYLRHTTIAAYLPIIGGKDAQPNQQDSVMGSMHDPIVAKEFRDARHRIINGHSKHEVRLADVLDPIYAAQIEQAGGGTEAMDLGFTVGEVPAFVAVPQGGTGLPPPSRWPYNPGANRRHGLLALGLVGGGMGAAWYFRDDLVRAVSAVRRRLGGRR
jgi:hypothetical protein